MAQSPSSGTRHPNHVLTHSPTEWIFGGLFRERFSTATQRIEFVFNEKTIFPELIFEANNICICERMWKREYGRTEPFVWFVCSIVPYRNHAVGQSLGAFSAWLLRISVCVCVFAPFMFTSFGFWLSSQSWGEIAGIAIWFRRSSHTRTQYRFVCVPFRS